MFKLLFLNTFIYLDGGVLNPFEFESSTLTIVLQQIIALKTIKSKFYVATACADLISTLAMVSILMMKVPYQTRVRIPVWDSLETFFLLCYLKILKPIPI